MSTGSWASGSQTVASLLAPGTDRQRTSAETFVSTAGYRCASKPVQRPTGSHLENLPEGGPLCCELTIHPVTMNGMTAVNIII